ncbi:MAG TPA: cupin domain-containing protein [Alphaproteobacteria bacterium]|nr:cupin domain-containing protein [Alphaproteobacteria bacterium]
MTDTLHVLGDLSVERFLAEYWQKRPLLIRQAVPGFHGPLTADELAGLALEDEVESRIVLEKGGRSPWELRHGPFTEEDFARLPKAHWSLLVQAVDHWVPEVADLLRGFRFIPNWRIDDVMVSYAPGGGSVGPHYDHYDVFLLQGTGRRRWRIGDACDDESPRVEGTPLRILRHMRTTEEWLLEPGDMLYLPPRIAHHGIAEGEEGCLTYSIGFRAPTVAELLTGLADFAADRIGDRHRYADPDLAPQENPGEIAGSALTRVRDLLAARIADNDFLADWFGAMMTEPKIDAAIAAPEKPLSAKRLRDRLAEGAVLRRNEGSRFAFFQDAPDAIRLFVDGAAHRCTGAAAAAARLLCAETEIGGAQLPDDAGVHDLVAELVSDGSLRID